MDKVGDDALLVDLFDFTVEIGPLGGELDLVFVPGVQVEGREGEIIFAAFTVINLIYLL
jgi:hypothetical protein